jgi:7-cyano-7-deazaguanine synthase
MKKKRCNQSILILYSGGLDSTILIYLAKILDLSTYCLGIDYGQKHIRELEKARRICASYELPYKEVKVDLPVQSRLTGGLEKEYTNVSEWYVPSRNFIFIALAASVSESEGINTIWLGANYADRLNQFPDCYQEWLVALNALLKINGSYPIQVEAPLMGLTKERVQELANFFGIIDEEVHSGYSE